MSLAALAVPLTTDPGAVKQCFRGLAAGLRRVLIGWVHGDPTNRPHARLLKLGGHESEFTTTAGEIVISSRLASSSRTVASRPLTCCRIACSRDWGRQHLAEHSPYLDLVR
jgi:hypothetical protein